jgi:hypothetical protein
MGVALSAVVTVLNCVNYTAAKLLWGPFMPTGFVACNGGTCCALFLVGTS